MGILTSERHSPSSPPNTHQTLDTATIVTDMIDIDRLGGKVPHHVIVPDISTKLHILRGLRKNMSEVGLPPLGRSPTTAILEVVAIATMVTMQTADCPAPTVVIWMTKTMYPSLPLGQVEIGRSMSAPQARSTTTTVKLSFHSGRNHVSGWTDPRIEMSDTPVILGPVGRDICRKMLKRIGTQVELLKSVKNILVTCDTWLRMVILSLINFIFWKSYNRVSQRCRQRYGLTFPTVPICRRTLKIRTGELMTQTIIVMLLVVEAVETVRVRD